ncbi:MAG: succinylglutamate-semialdehyde dehydrogenase [Opitutaceae bacterium]|nr:succinylglutamate-semialdehyde dehydrogenase [Opitutaceae bacterium]
MTTFSSRNPATGEIVWTGPAGTPDDVDRAVHAARQAFPRWSHLPLTEREAHLRAFAAKLEARKDRLAEAISREVGKPTWEALSEVQTMITKVEFSVTAHAQRCTEFAGGPAVTRFRPHGVVAVLGPFNFPGHLPNGHIVPALLAGNTVVFKPSKYAPLIAEVTTAVWHDSRLPAGVFNLVQSGPEIGAALARHDGINGLYFTGSSQTGLGLAEAFARTPERILALEMGGNNPLVVWQARDLRAAALLTVQSAYLSAGQRCTCARRLIVPDDATGAAFLTELVRRIGGIRVGAYTDRPEPFMGPVINAQAAREILQYQDSLLAHQGRPLVRARLLKEGTGLLTPGLIDVTAVPRRDDGEIFGPLLQVIRVGDFAAAMEEANRTCYGLAAGLISDDRILYERFRDEVRAGIINWNQPLTGASGAAPFGGVGRSGNHRPSAYFAADYCSYPVASIEVPELKLPTRLPPGLAD